VPLIDVLAGDRVTQVRWSAALGALENGSARGFGTVAKLLLDQELPVRVAAFSAFVELNTLYPGLASDLPRLDERLGVESGLDSDTLERLQHDLKNIFATTQGTTLLNLRPPFLRNDTRARRPTGALPMLLNVHSQEFADVDSGLLRKLSDLGETPTSVFVPPGDLPPGSPPPPPPPPTASTPPDNGDTGRTRYVNSWFVGHPDPMTPLRFRTGVRTGHSG
jgi:hypothetical protein